MLNFTTTRTGKLLGWFRGAPLKGSEAAAETGERKTCYLRGGPCDGTELEVEDCPPKVRVEKRYTVTAAEAEAVEEARTRTHRYRMMRPCAGGFIYVYDGSE